MLRLLKKADSLNSQDLEKQLATSLEVLYPVLNSLQIHKYVELENKSINKFILTKEGQQYAEKGMPEFVLWSIATKEGKPRADLEKEMGPVYKVAFANAMKKKVVAIKDDRVTRTVEELQDTDQAKLLTVLEGKGETLTK